MDLGTYKSGIWSERLAVFWLVVKGYTVLARRYKTKLGEIDIVARKNNTIVFIEVKYRKHLNANYDIISQGQLKRVSNAAKLYLLRHNLSNMNLRFDLITVINLISIKHIKNAW